MTQPMMTVQPGWYADPFGVVRWWEGQRWSGYTITPQGPKPNAAWGYALSSLLWVLGSLYAGLGVLQLSLLFTSRTQPPIGLVFVALGAYYIVGAIVCGKRERMPAPTTAPVAPPDARPMPGDAEGPSSGWYPAPSAARLRWWTGAQWTEYATFQGRVLPTYGVWRSMTLGIRWMLVLALLGVVAFVVGLMLWFSGAGTDPFTALWITSMVAMLGGGLFAILFGIFSLVYVVMRRRLCIPKRPPGL